MLKDISENRTCRAMMTAVVQVSKIDKIYSERRRRNQQSITQHRGLGMVDGWLCTGPHTRRDRGEERERGEGEGDMESGKG